MAVTITNQIRKYLLDELSSGNLPPAPSHRLPTERNLAKKFGTSRATVRQALTVLEVEGWVERRAGSGTYLRSVESSEDSSVTSLPANAVALATSPSQILEARAALEVKLAELVVANATEPDLRDICQHCERLTTNLSSDVFEHCDRMFHRSIALATHNELLIGCFDLLNIARDNPEWLKLKRKSPPERREFVTLEHQAICSAISDRDIELAKTATLEHITKVRMNLLGY